MARTFLRLDLAEGPTWGNVELEIDDCSTLFSLLHILDKLGVDKEHEYISFLNPDSTCTIYKLLKNKSYIPM